MRKNIFILLSIILVIVACKSRNNEKKSGALAGFSSYYNTIFNSKEALAEELRARESTHKDNFYAPYISLLKHDERMLGSDFGEVPVFSNDEGAAVGSIGQKNTTPLQISEAKAWKAISKYSVLKAGEEKNKRMFDAHLLLAQSRIYMGKPLEALDALNFIFNNMKKDKRMDLARVYQGLAYMKMRNFYRANEIFLSLKNDDIDKNYRKLQTLYYAELLLASGKKEEAAAELEEAFVVNKNKELRSRIAFLRGQILANIGRNEEARESFTTAYKYASDFEFEVKSQVEIAKTFNNGDDYEGAKKYIEGISKKGTYASRKNEFYYALGLMANKAGKPDEAQGYFNNAKKEKISDPQIRGLTFYEIGKYYADKNDYISAGAYYDSALAVMTYQPSKADLALSSRNIKDISKNYYLIKKSDSILALTKMSEPERNDYFTKYIDGIKLKEAKEEAALRKAEREKGFDTGEDYSANSIFAQSSGNSFQDFSGTPGGRNTFYFANQSTVSKGQSEFKRIWGDRSLVDNWRFSSRTVSLQDVKSEALGMDSGKNPRRLEPEFYIEKIPTDQSEILELKKNRDTASLGLGRMYENYFSDTELATKTLYGLVDNNPEEEVKLQALYQIFAMNYEKNPPAAERAKSLILSGFPYTSYAEFVKNPKGAIFSKSLPEVEGLYKQAYNLFKGDQFDESGEIITSALEKFPNDALVPKFHLLNAYNAGKTAGKEIMILQLQQIALNYAKTPEGLKAQQMLNFLKSDLQMQMTDAAGNQMPGLQNRYKSTEPPQNLKPVTEKDKMEAGQPNIGDEALTAEERKLIMEVENIQRQQLERLRRIDEENRKKQDSQKLKK